MLLYTFTTDGSSREDGNVYYADFLIVDVPESDKPRVDAEICNFFGISKSDPMLEMYRKMGITTPEIRALEANPPEPKDMSISSEDLEDKFGESYIDDDMLKDLAAALNAAGWKASKPINDFVTVNEE